MTGLEAPTIPAFDYAIVNPEEDPCLAMHHDYVCCRQDGHEGSHIATTFDRVIAIWDEELAWAWDAGWTYD
ncbi:hypothetical protein EniyanLRS_63 [Mycobacterium phage EniyanLRS]|uniref:Uncharacterized protein n=1 Tax=Mycobacterium phage EniyanLRS TaxID=1933770 RepID=A0A2H4GST7_9CAUD|nr:hypothetical protein EniyanLRS_63 [Mycobacterium phage EniyanLRS]